MVDPDLSRMLEHGKAKPCTVPEWLDFPNYYVTIDGRVWSIPRPGTSGGWLTPVENSHGYFVYGLCNSNGVQIITRARIVKLCFHGPPKEANAKHELRHLDDNRKNDSLENLEWGNAKSNADDRSRNGYTLSGSSVGTSKYREEDIAVLRSLVFQGKTKSQISDALGIPYRTVVGISRGDCWKHVTPLSDVKLKIHSIFLTLDGEVTLGGPWQWTTFVRLGGCNLRCWKSSGFCDAPSSLDITYPFPQLSALEVIQEVEKISSNKRVTISGGEPLLQSEEVCALAFYLINHGFVVSLETSGSKPLTSDQVRCFSCVIADIKTPSTEMDKFNCLEIYNSLRKTDYIKAVIETWEDFVWTLNFIDSIRCKARVSFSPRYGILEARELVEWIRSAKRFDIQLNLQSHKFIWPECHPPAVKSLKLVNVEEMSRSER